MNLQEWMDAKELSDAALSDKLGGAISRSQISRIRRRKSIPTADTARKLEAVTKIPAAKFLLEDRAA